MKIAGFRTFLVNAGRTSWVFLKLLTDDGVEGVGEATLEWRERTVIAAIEEAAAFLIGKDPFAVEHLVETLNRDSYWRTGAILRSAVSAVEAALLDIKGKALGVPVYDLLGGRQRETVRCYGNGWFGGAQTPAEFADKAREAVAMGFLGLKWDPFGTAYLHMSRPQRHRVIEIVEAVRAAVGPSIELMIEVHGRLDVPTAIAMARELQRFEPSWFEEPVPPESIDALADVRAASPIPIAAGERYYEPVRFLEIITKRAADILQPDVGHVGGLLEAKKIAGLAHMRFMPVAPHNPTGPVQNAMTLQLAASIPNLLTLETIARDVPWRADIVRENLQFSAGEIRIPTSPGLGVQLNEDACAQHPHTPHPIPFFTKRDPAAGSTAVPFVQPVP